MLQDSLVVADDKQPNGKPSSKAVERVAQVLGCECPPSGRRNVVADKSGRTVGPGGNYAARMKAAGGDIVAGKFRVEKIVPATYHAS
jgi:hypothetical protein